MNKKKLNFKGAVKKTLSKFSDDKYQLVVIGLFIFAYSWIYRVALRTIMDGSSFRWFNETHVRSWGEENKAFIFGSGTDGHFVIILLMTLFFLSLLWLIIRRPDAFTKTVLICWTSIFLIWQLILSFGIGTEYVIHGDSFGITLPYYILGPIEQFVLLVLAIFWCFRGSNEPKKYAGLSLNPVNHKVTIGILASFVITFLLLRFGEQDGDTDKAGIILMYIQLIALVINFLPQLPEGADENL